MTTSLRRHPRLETLTRNHAGKPIYRIYRLTTESTILVCAESGECFWCYRGENRIIKRITASTLLKTARKMFK